MTEIEEIKILYRKEKYTPSDKQKIKELAEKFNIEIKRCKCPNKWKDTVILLYSVLVNKKEALGEKDQIVYTGVGPVQNSDWGILSENTPRYKMKSIYETDYNLFKQFFKIIKDGNNKNNK